MKKRDWAIRDMPRPHAFIQWKGTDVCMDCYCVCGDQFHIDADFAYAVECKHCGRLYEMSAMIEMRDITNEEWDGCDPRKDNGIDIDSARFLHVEDNSDKR